MIRWCAFCQTLLGYSEPLADYSITHTICKKCRKSGNSLSEQSVSNMKNIRKFYDNIRENIEVFSETKAAKTLEEGLALGLEPMDIFMGIIQPILYDIGERYSQGKLKVYQEHQFTIFSQKFLFLIRDKVSSEPRSGGAELSPPQIDVLLMAAPGNYHTLGLQMLQVKLDSLGISNLAIYPAISLHEYIDLCLHFTPPIVAFSLSVQEQNMALIEMLKQIRQDKRLELKICVGGAGLLGHENEYEGLVDFVADIKELDSFFNFIKNG